MKTVMAYLAAFLCSIIAIAPLGTGRISGEEPSPGDRRAITFVAEGGEECVIAFRWCPSGVMKDGDPDSPEGMPRDQVEGFWLSETEVSQHDYRIIAGDEALGDLKAFMVSQIGKSLPEPLPSWVIEERQAMERDKFGDDQMPLWGIGPHEADDFCIKAGVAHKRSRNADGRSRKAFETLLFRLPSHFEWQYAYRGQSGRKHFLQWPESPDTAKVVTSDGGKVQEFDNYKEYLQKKNPERFAQYKEVFERFDGTEESMATLLCDESLAKDARSYLEELLRGLLVVRKDDMNRVADTPASSWNIKGMDANVAEWVLLVPSPFADRSNMPSPGDFVAGSDLARATFAGSWNSASGKTLPWQHLSIWHWQQKTAYGSKPPGKARGQAIGLRILMMDAVADTWFADLRQMAEQAYDGELAADALAGGFESGMEVVGRDREGRNTAQARIGIYGALAKAKSGDSIAAGKLLKDSVASLGEGGDEFFQQLSVVIQDEDIGPQGSKTRQ